MAISKQFYLTYWKQLKLFVMDQDLDWEFPSFEGQSETVVKIGYPKYKIVLSLKSTDTNDKRPIISASFWIPDSKEAFALLKVKRMQIEKEMGKLLMWDSKPGRKSCWIRMAAALDIADERNWPASFEWIAENAGKLREVCHKYLAESKVKLDLEKLT